VNVAQTPQEAERLARLQASYLWKNENPHLDTENLQAVSDAYARANAIPPHLFPRVIVRDVIDQNRPNSQAYFRKGTDIHFNPDGPPPLIGQDYRNDGGFIMAKKKSNLNYGDDFSSTIAHEMGHAGNAQNMGNPDFRVFPKKPDGTPIDPNETYIDPTHGPKGAAALFGGKNVKNFYYGDIREESPWMLPSTTNRGFGEPAEQPKMANENSDSLDQFLKRMGMQ